MPQWGANNVANNMPKYGVFGRHGLGDPVHYGANVAASHGNVVFGVPVNKKANTVATHSGWVRVYREQGGITAFNVTAAGSGFSNGETVTVSNGSVNAVGTVVANSQGNLVSVAVTTPGTFTNTSILSFAFNREKHMVNITVGGTPTGYSNTDTIQAGNGTINATATISTNSTGGFVTANLTITNPGLWANTKANTDVSFSVRAANGSASAGSGATFTANIASSTGGTVTANLGGRAGRVTTEVLVATGTIAANGGGSEFNNLV